MRKYEIGLLFDAGLEKKKLEKVLKEFEDFVKKSKGQIIEKKQWKEYKLAYPIKKAESGIYFFAHYELETDKNSDLLKDLNLNQDILRYLITIPPKGVKLEGESKKVKRGKHAPSAVEGAKGKKRLEKEVKKESVEKPEREKVEPKEVEPKKEVEKKPTPAKVEKVEEKKVEKPAYAKASAGKKVEEKPEEKPKIRKTVEESKKAKSREQKEKKVSEEKLDQEIDRILSDEDLL